MSSPSHTIIGKPYIQLVKVDSTNNYAMAQIHNGLAVHGATWFTRIQTAGKGQRGKQWNASEGLNLLQSTVIDASAFQLQQAFALTVVIANACYDFFSKYAGDETTIKWPNDIYWRDRKAGGILIENVIRGQQWSWAVVGAGININQTSFEGLPNPVSLKQITGQTYEPVTLGQELCSFIEMHYQAFREKGMQPALERYNDHLYKKGQEVVLARGEERFAAVVKCATADGDLLLEHSPYERVSFGEVEWIIG